MDNDTYLHTSTVIKKLDDLSVAIGGSGVPTTTIKTNSDFVIGINKSIDAASGKTGVEYPPYAHNTLVTNKLDGLAEAIAEGGGGGPAPVMGALTATENGNYIPSDYDYDGFNSVNVNVPEPPTPVTDALSVTENGTYLPSDYSCDAFSQVNVNVASGLTVDQFYNNQTVTLGKVLSSTPGYESAFIYNPSNNTYNILALKEKAKFGLIINEIARGLIVPYLAFEQSNYAPTIGSSFESTGRELFYPIDSTELASYGSYRHNSQRIDGIPYYNVPSRVINIDTANSHPVALKEFGNGQVGSLKHMIESVTIKDWYTIVPNASHTISWYCVYLYNGKYYMAYGLDDADQWTYDTVNDGVTRYSFYYKELSMNDSGYIYSKRVVQSFSSQTGGTRIPVDNIRFNSFDILDENGTVIIPSNCTLSDIGI